MSVIAGVIWAIGVVFFIAWPRTEAHILCVLVASSIVVTTAVLRPPAKMAKHVAPHAIEDAESHAAGPPSQEPKPPTSESADTPRNE